MQFDGPVEKWLARLATLIAPNSPLSLLVILNLRTSGGSMRTSCQALQNTCQQDHA